MKIKAKFTNLILFFLFGQDFSKSRQKPIISLGVPRGMSFDYGGYRLQDSSISQVISHVTPYEFNSSHWLKLQHSDWRANLVKGFFFK